MQDLGDPLLLQMLINNLLENAVKYSSKEKPIKAVLKKETGEVALQIIDEGPGIAEDEKKKVFSKFYRIGNEAEKRREPVLGYTFAVRLPKTTMPTFR